MNRYVAPFLVAKLAVEKKFALDTEWFYNATTASKVPDLVNRHNESLENFFFAIRHDPGNEVQYSDLLKVQYYSKLDATPSLIPAPYRFQLQEWLREIHKIEIVVHSSLLTGSYFANIPSFIEGHWHSANYTDYNLALDAALEQALKQVKL